MTDMVSIRMPVSLVKELQAISDKKHYLDLSELIRSIVRSKAQQYNNPYASNIQKIVHDIQKQVSMRHKQEDKEIILSHIKKLIDEVNS